MIVAITLKKLWRKEFFEKEAKPSYMKGIEEAKKEHFAELKKVYEAEAEEIKTHKEEVFAKIDKDIYRIISRVVKEVIGKTLELEDHQKLVTEALKEAKKEGFFEA